MNRIWNVKKWEGFHDKEEFNCYSQLNIGKYETFHLNLKHLEKYFLKSLNYLPLQNLNVTFWGHMPPNKLWCSWPDLLLARDTCWGSCLSRSGCWSPCCHERSVLIQETLILTLAVSSATPASPDPATTISDLLTLVS